MKELTRNRLWLTGLVAMAVALNIQPTLFFGAAEMRVALSDVLALLLSPLALWLAWVYRGLWNKREIWIGLSLVAATSAVMTIGLIKAWASPQGISTWAIVKYAGWYLLVYYSILGVLAGRLAPENAVDWFIRFFVLSHAFLIVVFIAFGVVGISWPGPESPRMTGLFGNANAYGLSLLCGFALLIGSGRRLFTGFSLFAFDALCATICAGVLYTRSLGTLAGLLVLTVIFICARRELARSFTITCLALAIYSLPWAGNALLRLANFPLENLQSGIGSKLVSPDDYARSISRRLELNSQAAAQWREFPTFGAGLGAFIRREGNRVKPPRSGPLKRHFSKWSPGQAHAC